ncbi:MAG: DUF4013 domain-containing protein [Candidatus Altiarchaeota archaeon]|nr:DUF4013 domain-containing protein [Candidatus Altiarchaeota archaeon]
MVNLVDYERAIKRPFMDSKTLAIGVVLGIASLLLTLLIIPGLLVEMLVTGFYLKCGKTAMNQDFKLPEWVDWGKLFVSGLIAFVIVLIYMLPALIVMAVSFGAFLVALISGAETGSEGMAVLSVGSIIIGALVSLVLVLLAGYMLPAALLAYVKDDKFGSAFKFGEIKKKILTLNYFVPWVLMVLYYIVVVGVLSIIPVIGTALGSFMAGVTMFTVFGEVCSET